MNFNISNVTKPHHNCEQLLQYKMPVWTDFSSSFNQFAGVGVIIFVQQIAVKLKSSRNAKGELYQNLTCMETSMASLI